MKDWRCLLGRHAPVRVVDSLDFTEASLVLPGRIEDTSVAFGGRVTASHRACLRCEKNLDMGRPLRHGVGHQRLGAELWLGWATPRIETGFAAEDAVYVYFGVGRAWLRWG